MKNITKFLLMIFVLSFFVYLSACNTSGGNVEETFDEEKSEKPNDDITDNNNNNEHIHSWTVVEIIEKDGKYVATLTCETDSSHKEEVLALVSEKVIINPTCTSAGESSLFITVKYQGEVLKTEERKVTIEALGHDLVSHEAKAATCTESGYNAYEECSRCSYTTYEEINSLGHSFKVVSEVEPGCETQGCITKECVCGEIEYIYSSALGHEQADTYSYDDMYHWFGSLCGHAEAQSEEEFHEFIWEQKSPETCTEAEVLVGTCYCGYQKVTTKVASL